MSYRMTSWSLTDTSLLKIIAMESGEIPARKFCLFALSPTIPGSILVINVMELGMCFKRRKQTALMDRLTYAGLIATGDVAKPGWQE